MHSMSIASSDPLPCNVSEVKVIPFYLSRGRSILLECDKVEATDYLGLVGRGLLRVVSNKGLDEVLSLPNDCPHFLYELKPRRLLRIP